MKTFLGCAALVCLALASGCGSGEKAAVGRDAGAFADAGLPDAGVDAGGADGGTSDAGSPDAGVSDAGAPDAGPQTLTIHGRLVDQNGQPVVGLVALNERFDLAVTAAADGTFTFEDVLPPYDLSASTGSKLTELRGLTRADPTVVTADRLDAAPGTNLHAVISQPTYPLPAGEGVVIGARGVTESFDSSGSANINRLLYLAGGVSTLSTDLVGLHFSADASGHVTFLGFGTIPDVTLVAGQAESGLTFDLSEPVATQSTTVTASFGAYATSASLRLGTATVDAARLSVNQDVQSGDQVTLPGEGGSFVIRGSDVHGNQALQSVKATLGGDTALAFPASIQLDPISPQDGATGMPRATVLQWTPVPDAALVYVLVKDPANGNAIVYQAALPGSADQLSLTSSPDLGIGLAADHLYGWQVQALVADGTSVDALADGSERGILQRTGDDAVTAYTTVRWGFTTAP